VRVTLGADGAPCNNNLSIFQEMRLAALIQKPRLGPEVMDAETVVRMATIEGARALGLGDLVGSVEVGKKADVVVVRVNRVHQVPAASVYSQLVYASRASDVEAVLVGGQPLVLNGRLTNADEREIVRRAEEQVRRVVNRADLQVTWP
ncbi:MAG TPA: N-ethylammeline chlorohydrolase, partial [Bacteroidetes bacterium]|nr:N-ethylammeline chlorohydrolase [Bacteroidota bacterium]